jgi:hypothetical protein
VVGSCQLLAVSYPTNRRKPGMTEESKIMKSKTAQWILWAVAMVIFTTLTVSSLWDWLGLAIMATAVIWYTVVPNTHSRQQ